MSFELHLKTEEVIRAHPADAVCVGPHDSVRSVLHRMKDEQTGSVLITSEKKLVGIFTERDALKLLAQGADLEIPIRDAMIGNPVTVLVSDTVGKAISKMSHGGYRRLPVVDEAGHAISILKVSGILRYLVEHFPDVVYTLPPEPHHHTKTREGA